MIKFDLTSAYHFIEIYKPHTKFLGFSLKDKTGKTNYFKFLVLPFGLSSACSVFTRPLIAKWRDERELILMFLDDGFGCAHIFSSSEQLAMQIKSDLLMSGFIPNATKSEWVPVQVIEYLGVSLNSLEGTMSIPQRRLCKALDTISDIFLCIKTHCPCASWQVLFDRLYLYHWY